MISANVRLRNPFPAKPFRNIWNYVRPVWKNKYVEIQFSHYAFNWIELSVDLNWRQTDHAGPWITVNVLGWTLDIRMFDQRRWDDDRNHWATD